MKQRLNVGIVGLGFGLSVHLPAWNRLVNHPEFEVQVVSLATKAPESAQRIPKDLKLKVYSFEEMLLDSDVDVISFAVPPNIQADLIIRAIKKGKHIFCEKPLSNSLESATSCFEHVIASGLKHGINLILPEINAWKELKKVLSTIGKPREILYSWIVGTRAYSSKDPSWKKNEGDGGGVLLNFATHSFFGLEYLFGNISEVFAGSHINSNGTTSILASFASGLNASLHLSAEAIGGSGHRLEVYGESGSLHLYNNSGDFVNGFSLTRCIDGISDPEIISDPRASSPGDEDGRIGVVSAVMERFLNSFTNDLVRSSNLKDGLRVQAIVDAVQRSKANVRWVNVPNE